MKEYQKIQDYILLCLTSGIYQSPRRSLDWVMKYKNYNDKEDNYVDMKKKVFVFNKFKTNQSMPFRTSEICCFVESNNIGFVTLALLQVLLSAVLDIFIVIINFTLKII